MIYNGKSGLILAWLCMAILLSMSLTGAAWDSYGSNSKSALGTSDLYEAMSDPYAISASQSALDRAVALREIQKMNYGYYHPAGENSWDYWANMWLKDDSSTASVYRLMQDPYAYGGSQSALDSAAALKEIQKSNYGYYSPSASGNWDYWTRMWLNLQ